MDSDDWLWWTTRNCDTFGWCKRQITEKTSFAFSKPRLTIDQRVDDLIIGPPFIGSKDQSTNDQYPRKILSASRNTGGGQKVCMGWRGRPLRTPSSYRHGNHWDDMVWSR